MSLFIIFTMITSCNKDDDDSNDNSATIEDAQSQDGTQSIKPQTYPITVRVKKQTSTSKIGLGNDGLKLLFEESDVLVLEEWGWYTGEVYAELTLVSGANESDAVFAGEISADAVAKTLRAHIGSRLTDEKSHTSYANLSEAVKSCSFLTSTETFSYYEGAEIPEIVLSDENAYITISSPMSRAELIIDDTPIVYDIIDGKACIAVRGGQRVKSTELIFTEKNTEAGKVYRVNRSKSFNPKGFAVADGRQVLFSNGNLQYHCEDHIWRTAAHQYDFIGSTSNSGVIYDGWIDLFVWGTGNEPTRTAQNDVFTDWGINIGDGKTWRTPTYDEFLYVIRSRTTNYIRHIKAQVNGVNGVILFPDGWNPETFDFYKEAEDYLNDYIDFNKNIISKSQWEQFETEGAIFLPAAIYNFEEDSGNANNVGVYWAKEDNIGSAYGWYIVHSFIFNSGELYFYTYNTIHPSSVRLIYDL